MTTKKEAVEKLIESRNACGLQYKIEPMIESETNVSIKVVDGNGTPKTFVRTFEPPKPEFEADIIGTITRQDGSLRIKVLKSCDGESYCCADINGQNELVFDSFTPLSVYKEKEILEKAYERACGWLFVETKCRVCPMFKGCNTNKKDPSECIREFKAHFLKEAGERN